MTLKSFLLDYGEEIDGYDVAVVNEREARAAAGILFMLGMIVIFLGIGFNHIIIARVYLAFLFLDFTMRIFSPKYVPSLMLGRFFVKNQAPEYTGGLQKRFAWTLGWLIAIPMLDWFVIHWDINFYKVLICILCLTLMFFESAFGICIGCMIYKFIVKDNPKYCPGGVCEIEQKSRLYFNPLQKFILAAVSAFLVAGVYLMLAKIEPKTFFGEFLHEMILTKKQLQHENDLKIQKEFEDDDF